AAAHRFAADAAAKADAKAADAAARASVQRVVASQRAAQADMALADRQAAAEAKAAAKAAAAVMAAQKQKADALGRTQHAEAAAATMTDRLVESAGKVALSYAGLGAIESVFRGIAGAISGSREKSIQFAESLLKTKDELAEVATLRVGRALEK